VIDEELARPEAFDLAVRSRASFLARETGYEYRELRPYSQLTLLLDIELDLACEMLKARGLHGAYRWAFTAGTPLST
jgi:hypothetical protein